MQAPLSPLHHSSPHWEETSTGSGGALAGDAAGLEPAVTPPPTELKGLLLPEPPTEAAEPLLLPPPAPQVFDTLRSEDGRVTLTNENLELNGEQFAWRALEGVDVQLVRWLLGVLLGAFVFCGFLLAYLQFWLKTAPAALGIGLGLALLAWGLRGTNRWRLYQPGCQTRYFAFTGPARGWQMLAREANRRIGQRHHETATTTAYWLQRAALTAPTPDSAQDQPNPHPPA